MTATRVGSDAVSVRVDDMSCGHCVAKIRAAIETATPGARVAVDLNTHRVTVEGAQLSAVLSAVTGAGYSPVAETV